MGRTVSIGAQGFAQLREGGYFFVDKTGLIRRWWENGDPVTLVCRPRRFGKTLNLSMVECFFSRKYAGRGDELFGGLEIWDDPKYRELQGTMPVVAISFAGCKGGSFEALQRRVCEQLALAWATHGSELDSVELPDEERLLAAGKVTVVDALAAPFSLNRLCTVLERATGSKPIVLLDEYDTPMQEAWLCGCWDKMAEFVRSLFNNTFKTNGSLGRALITGITRVSRESVFSDLNNISVATASTPRYEECFGFTESEVFEAMDEMGLFDREGVKQWYDGFVFGGVADIYNPWSIVNYLSYGTFDTYWANTSSNALISSILRTGNGSLQHDFEGLLKGQSITCAIDEQVVFRDLGGNPAAVWSLLLATGYLKITSRTWGAGAQHVLELTNLETKLCFDRMVRSWFDARTESYGAFGRALLACDFEAANDYLSDVLLGCVSGFDGGAAGGGASAPENFYHGLVLGLLVELRGRYEVTSNRESGYGRYDVMLAPLGDADPAFVIEFKVRDPRREADLAATARRAHEQIEQRAYAAQLVERGIAPGRIRELAFAFEGKSVLIV